MDNISSNSAIINPIQQSSMERVIHLSEMKDRSLNSPPALRKVAEEFESLFINEMLKRAHSAKLAKTILSSDAEDTYTSMLNQERSKVMAKSHNFGIAEALVGQFSTNNKRPSEYSFNKDKKD